MDDLADHLYPLPLSLSRNSLGRAEDVGLFGLAHAKTAEALEGIDREGPENPAPSQRQKRRRMINSEVLDDLFVMTNLSCTALREVAREYGDRLFEQGWEEREDMPLDEWIAELFEGAEVVQGAAYFYLKRLFKLEGSVNIRRKLYVYREEGKQVRVVREVLDTKHMEDADFFDTYQELIDCAVDAVLEREGVQQMVEEALGLRKPADIEETEDDKPPAP